MNCVFSLIPIYRTTKLRSKIIDKSIGLIVQILFEGCINVEFDMELCKISISKIIEFSKAYAFKHNCTRAHTHKLLLINGISHF